MNGHEDDAVASTSGSNTRRRTDTAQSVRLRRRYASMLPSSSQLWTLGIGCLCLLAPAPAHARRHAPATKGKAVTLQAPAKVNDDPRENLFGAATPGGMFYYATSKKAYCKRNEELCPIFPGSAELHCVDFTATSTCGGCVTDGTGLDCESSKGTFMNACTSRGQCTGCRWEKGGLNASLSEPDFLRCSVTLTAPLKTFQRSPRREPVLGYERVVEELKVRKQPLAAHIKQDQYAGEEHHIAPGAAKGNAAKQGAIKGGQASDEAEDGEEGEAAPPAGRARARKAAPKKPPKYDLSKPESLPELPPWLSMYLRGQLRELPLTTNDDTLLSWLRRYKKDLLDRIVSRNNIIARRPPTGGHTNAERFKLALPPLPPKMLQRRISKVEEERKRTADEDKSHLIWGSTLQEVLEDSDARARTFHPQILETLWELVIRLAAELEIKAGNGETIAAPGLPESAARAEKKAIQEITPAKAKVQAAAVAAAATVVEPLDNDVKGMDKKGKQKQKASPDLDAAVKEFLETLEAADLPEPPTLLNKIITEALPTIPMSTEDEPLVKWLRKLRPRINSARKEAERQKKLDAGDSEGALWYIVLDEISNGKYLAREVPPNLVEAGWELVTRVAIAFDPVESAAHPDADRGVTDKPDWMNSKAVAGVTVSKDGLIGHVGEDAAAAAAPVKMMDFKGVQGQHVHDKTPENTEPVGGAAQKVLKADQLGSRQAEAEQLSDYELSLLERPARAGAAGPAGNKKGGAQNRQRNAQRQQQKKKKKQDEHDSKDVEDDLGLLAAGDSLVLGEVGSALRGDRLEENNTDGTTDVEDEGVPGVLESPRDQQRRKQSTPRAGTRSTATETTDTLTNADLRAEMEETRKELHALRAMLAELTAPRK